MHTLLCVLYFAVLLLLSCYGLHRSHLVYLCFRHRDKLATLRRTPFASPSGRLRVSGVGERGAFDSAPPISGERPARFGRAGSSTGAHASVTASNRPPASEQLPMVTLQLPLYNEATVAPRLLDAVARMDYPADRLEVQVLDDSTDETRAMVRAHVERLQAEGLDFVYIHRTDRTGYKAGALDAGLAVAKGDLIAIFDADFIPQPDFLRACVRHFDDPRIAMVQTRWAHLNRDHSLLTGVQALMLDGHHMVENRARFASGCLFNFSGTGGIWRKEAIADAGGWQHDTLTEDLDLSYRAQLAGWKFVYRDDVISPAELPEDVSAFRAQQFRWAKGTVQTSRKVLARVLADKSLSPLQRVEAFFHLTPHFAYPLMVLLSVLLLPALILMPATDVKTMIVVDLPLCVGTMGSLGVFYALAERAQGRTAWGAIRKLPALLALGAGLAPHLTKAVFEGLDQMAGEFVRTPKKGTKQGRYRARTTIPVTEVGLAGLSALSVAASVQTGHWFATPFALLFTAGYAYVAGLVLAEQVTDYRAARASAPGVVGVTNPAQLVPARDADGSGELAA